jgi:hypothetical protein
MPNIYRKVVFTALEKKHRRSQRYSIEGIAGIVDELSELLREHWL